MGDKLFSHEYDFSYDSKRRFVSYWHQIREVISCDPLQVLEIGVGSGFVSRYLRGGGGVVCFGGRLGGEENRDKIFVLCLRLLKFVFSLIHIFPFFSPLYPPPHVN